MADPQPPHPAEINQFAQRRLHPVDAATYGVEWVDVERGLEAISDLDFDGQLEIEKQVQALFGATLTRFLGSELASLSLDSMRVRLWLGLRAAGVEVPKLAEFKPRCFNLGYRARPADADPPAETSGSSPGSTATPTPA